MGLHLKVSDEMLSLQFDSMADVHKFTDTVDSVLASAMVLGKRIDEAPYKAVNDAIKTGGVLFAEFPIALWTEKVSCPSWAGTSIVVPFSVLVLSKLGLL